MCGRTILKGERTRQYVSPDGDERAICDLCRERVEAAGWTRAGQAVEHRQAPQRQGAAESSAERSAPQIKTRPDTPQRRLRRALEEFNDSEHRLTVAGLTRSLGPPRVSAVAPPETPHDVRLTVAWDLSWYQWEVRLADEPARVRALAKGSEIGQLGNADRAG